MINNVTFSITNKCNGKCKMCNIWKEVDYSSEMNVEAIEKLFSDNSLSNVETISITGGEPFLRSDITNIIDTISNKLPKLNRIFLNTNGTIIDKVVEVCDYCTKKVDNVILSISLEGTRKTNKKIRGIDTYNNVIKLINSVKEKNPNVFINISTTLINENSNFNELNHLKKLSEKLKCGFSFRFADISNEYYKNGNMNLDVDGEKKKIVSDFIKYNMNDNEFLEILKKYIDTNEIPILFDKEGNNRCLAGKEFVFIKANGEITPCLYSSRIIGSLTKRICDENIKLGSLEKCPCCTDCTIYPIIEFLKRESKEEIV